MIVLLVSVAVALGGLLIFAFAEKDKPRRVGEILFACGVLATLLLVGGGKLHLP